MQKKAGTYQEKLFMESVQRLSDHMAFGSIASLINSLALSFVLWDVTSKALLITWFALLFAVSLIRLYLQRTYPTDSPTLANVERWKNWFLLTLVFSGLIWGASAVFLFPHDSIGHQVFIAFVLGGMVAGTVGAFAVVMPAFLAYSIPALLPIIVRFSSINDTIHIVMGLMLCLFWLLMLFTAQRFNKAFATSLGLQYENVDLIAELQIEVEERKKIERKLEQKQKEIQKNEQFVQSEEELIKKTEEIEAIVQERTRELMDANEKLVKEIDIREKAEAATQLGRREWESTFDAMSDWMSLIDLEGEILRSNRAGEKLLGLPLQNIIGRACCELLHGEKEFIAECPMRKMLQSQKRESADILVKETNRWLRISVDPVMDENGNLIKAVHVVRDVTNLKKLEEERLRQQRELEQIRQQREAAERERRQEEERLKQLETQRERQLEDEARKQREALEREQAAEQTVDD